MVIVMVWKSKAAMTKNPRHYSIDKTGKILQIVREIISTESRFSYRNDLKIFVFLIVSFLFPSRGPPTFQLRLLSIATLGQPNRLIAGNMVPDILFDRIFKAIGVFNFLSVYWQLVPHSSSIQCKALTTYMLGHMDCCGQ